MNGLKRLCLRALLNKEQRTTILRSVAYSERKYRKRGNTRSASRTASVREELNYLLGEAERKEYTKTEVKNIVEYYLNDFYRYLVRKTKASCVAVGAVVERDKCAECDKSNDCVVNRALFTDGDDKGAPEGEENLANETETTNTSTSVPEGGSGSGSCDTVATLAAAAEVARKKAERGENGDVNNV